MGRSSKQGSKAGGMEIDTLPKFKEEPHLSGAYIRSLVKQLTSSRTKDPLIPKDPDCVDAADGFPAQSVTKFNPCFSETQQTPLPQHPPQHHKKQIRRRLHTSRPYQERLLNMAEARREIVTALKFHRAAMKQANEQQPPQSQSQPQLPHPPPPPPPPPQHSLEQEGKIESRRNPRIYPSSTANFPNYLDYLSYSSLPCTPPNPFSWPASPIAPSPAIENFNLALPNQTLGLNLNFYDFNNLDATLYHNHPPSISSSSSLSSSSPPLSIATEEVPSAAISQDGPAVMTGGGLHPAMDDEEMAEIRSIGEQHETEWNDTMNLVTSAWWFKFLKTMEFGPEVKIEDDGNHPFNDEVMEFPSWLNANESCLQQHLNDFCSEDYMQHPALPCMDVGEIEGMDGEWLA